MSTAERVLVLWVPDWPVQALLRDEQADPPPPGAPIALVAQQRIVACSAEARAEGVRVGLREREAQTRCPDLVVRPHDPAHDERCFGPVLAQVERLVPGVEPRRPGLCAMRARGPARYYGGEEAAATALLALAERLELHDARIGIADGLFCAEQAARAASTAAHLFAPRPGVRIVEPGGSAAFLSGLPVSRAAGSALAETLQGLGIRTLGALAALPEDAVQQRFGATGVSVHRRARALGPSHGGEVRPRTAVRDLAAEMSFEPPVDSTDRLAFACAALADRFISALGEERLVCTALRIELTDDTGARHEREWAHPYRFTPSDTVDRVRWQAASHAQSTERGGAGIVLVRITPTHTDRAAAHEPGLWSTEPDTRVHHHLSRAQSRLGHTGVGTAQLSGGRLLSDRQRFVPWGTQQTSRGVRDARDSAAGPWPGSIPGPLPTQVFPEPLPAEILDAGGAPVSIDADSLLTADPATLRVGGAPLKPAVQAWSPPWPMHERWWEGHPARHRLQLVLADGDAWLLCSEQGAWFAEGRYS